MSESTFRRLGTLIDQIPAAGSDPAGSLDEITGPWAEAVGSELASHTSIALEGSELLVLADTPVWGHLLTQQKLSILKHLKISNPEINRISVKVRPQSPDRVPLPVNRPPRPLDSSSSRALSQSASSVKTTGLRDVLLRISRHGKSYIPATATCRPANIQPVVQPVHSGQRGINDPARSVCVFR